MTTSRIEAFQDIKSLKLFAAQSSQASFLK